MKYSPELTEVICKAILEGSSDIDACYLAGIHKATFYEWIKTRPDFADALKKSELECKNRNIRIIQKAAITTWQAAAWLLERRYHAEYALKNQWGANQGMVFPFTVVRPNENIRKAA